MVSNGLSERMARMVLTQCSAPPSLRSSRVTLVRTACFSCMDWMARAMFSGSRGSGCGGVAALPTAQNLQVRVQMLPRSRNVAVPRDQHSCRFGQSAERQTVLRLERFSSCFVDANDAPAVNLIFSHSGFFPGLCSIRVLRVRF